jgi:hypothetical protein
MPVGAKDRTLPCWISITMRCRKNAVDIGSMLIVVTRVPISSTRSQAERPNAPASQQRRDSSYWQDFIKMERI